MALSFLQNQTRGAAGQPLERRQLPQAKPDPFLPLAAAVARARCCSCCASSTRHMSRRRISVKHAHCETEHHVGALTQTVVDQKRSQEAKIPRYQDTKTPRLQCRTPFAKLQRCALKHPPFPPPPVTSSTYNTSCVSVNIHSAALGGSPHLTSDCSAPPPPSPPTHPSSLRSSRPQTPCKSRPASSSLPH